MRMGAKGGEAGQLLRLHAPPPASTSPAEGKDGAMSGDCRQQWGRGKAAGHLLVLSAPHPTSNSLPVAPAGEASRLNTTCLQAGNWLRAPPPPPFISAGPPAGGFVPPHLPAGDWLRRGLLAERLFHDAQALLAYR